MVQAKREEILSEIEQKVQEGELTMVEVERRLRKGRGDSYKEAFHSRIAEMDEVDKIADCLPEGTSVKITDSANIILYGFSPESNYKPDFRSEPDESKNDWAFFIDGNFVGWNTMSGGLSNIKGYRCSPSKLFDFNWREQEEINATIKDPKEKIEHSVNIISHDKFTEE